MINSEYFWYSGAFSHQAWSTKANDKIAKIKPGAAKNGIEKCVLTSPTNNNAAAMQTAAAFACAIVIFLFVYYT